ncbi:MAG: metal ABC transporter ATP-binding protein [Synechococcus sp.]
MQQFPTPSTAAAAEPLHAQGLAYAYDGKPVLVDVSLSLVPGSLNALVGANGAGKSTLLHVLQGQLKPQAGGVWLGDQPIQRCRPRVALMPQRGRIDWSFPITVRDMVALGQVPGPRTTCCELDAALQRVGLLPMAGRRLDALSGGQQQRALLARALLQPAQVLLLDEPCAAIDPPARQQLLQLMRQLAAAGYTLLVSSHDWGDALDVYDRVIVLAGRVQADGTPSDVRHTLAALTDLGNHCCG